MSGVAFFLKTTKLPKRNEIGLTVYDGNYVSVQNFADIVGEWNATVMKHSTEISERKFKGSRATNFISLEGIKNFLIEYLRWEEEDADKVYRILAKKDLPSKKRALSVSSSSSSSEVERRVEEPVPVWWPAFRDEIARLTNVASIISVMETPEFKAFHKEKMDQEIKKAVAEFKPIDPMHYLPVIQKELEGQLAKQARDDAAAQKNNLLNALFSRKNI